MLPFTPNQLKAGTWCSVACLPHAMTGLGCLGQQAAGEPPAGSAATHCVRECRLPRLRRIASVANGESFSCVHVCVLVGLRSWFAKLDLELNREVGLRSWTTGLGLKLDREVGP